MEEELLGRFATVIANLPDSAFLDTTPPDRRLLLGKDGPVEVFYAPFDYTNVDARLVIVGLTPGRTQMMNALKVARRHLRAGAASDAVLRAAKTTASFSGAMRPNLVALLEGIGLHRWLSLGSCAELFSSAHRLVQTTSVLQFPVFVNGKNYSGSPDPLSSRFLKDFVVQYFGQEAHRLRQAVFVPLGDKAARILHFLASQGAVDPARIFDGLPHPSGANAERIAYFLGQKPRAHLSKKTDPLKLDYAKRTLLEKVALLPSSAW